MGTRCAPQFANLFLACLEEKALSSWTGPDPLVWLRFLDDIMMLWPGDQEQLQQLLQHLNNQMQSINFTMTSSQENITFLDLEIFKGHRFRRESILDTKLFIKPTNPRSFLHFTSCHPISIFSTIVKGELLRVLRATSDKEDYTMGVNLLLDRFSQRGYPRDFLQRITDSVRFEDRGQHLEPQLSRSLPPDVTIFSCRHHPAISSSDIWQSIWDEETPFSPMIVRPRPPSHRDMLVKAKTPGRDVSTRRTTTSPPPEAGTSSDTGAPPT